ncbi:MAG: T9SS type A sorting domain-containing protein [Aureispira sp.]
MPRIFQLNRQTIYFSIFVLWCFLLFPFHVKAQIPGGVNTGLELWHKGEDIPNPAAPGTTTGNQNWPDANPSSPLSPSVYTNPSGSVYGVSDNLNFNRTLDLNDEWWQSSLDINSSSFFSGVNVFTVFRPTAPGNIYLWGNGAAGQPNRGRQAYTEQLTDGSGLPSAYNVGGTGFNPYINFMEIREGIPSNPQTSNIYLNGGYLVGIPTLSTIESPGDVTPHLFIGKASEDDSPSFSNGLDMELAEFIVYSGTLTTEERVKITSYLGIKYGITLSHNYVLSNDSIAWDIVAGAGYNNNIIGIARDIDPLPNGSNGDLQQNRSRSEEAGDDLEINALANYQNTTGRRSLMLGHNGAQTNNTNNISIDNNFFRRGRRIRRVWRCQETNDNGNYSDYTISFNNTISLPSGFNPNNMVLLVSTDETFSSNVMAYPLRPNGSYTGATGVDMPAGVSYMTIAQMETVTWVHTTAPNNNIGGGSVNTLSDQVLGINDMQGANLTGNNPTFSSNPANSFMNFHPYVTFNDGGNDNWIERDEVVGFARNASSTFLVMRNDNSGGNNQVMLSYATESSPGNTEHSGNTLRIRRPSSLTVDVNGSGGGYDSNWDMTTNNEVRVISHVRGNNSNDRVSLNGSEATSNYSDFEIIRSNGTLIIGQEQDDMGDPSDFRSGERLEDDFAELITFNERLSPLETQQVHSYLAVKYGLLLAHDYIAADGDIVWDRTINTDYNRTIGGIGRDDVMGLDQRKTRSQKADPVVTIEHPNPFPADDSYLLWGSVLYSSGTTPADYDVIGTTGAPQGFEISERHWKVSNPNDRVGSVIVRMDIPPSRVGNLVGVKLLKSTNPDFSVGLSGSVSGTVVGSSIEFTVTFFDGEYFALGFDTDLFYTNNELNAPSSFEACAGDSVTFRYRALSTHPQDVRLKSNSTSNPFTYGLNITVSNQQPDSVGVRGEIAFRIPDDAVTGNILFLDAPGNGSVIYNSNMFLTIHNPTVAFVPENNPICADQNMELFGFPEGGTFYSSIPGLISPSGDSLYGLGAGWSAFHDDSLVVDVTYQYYAKYTNGLDCAFPRETMDSLVIRDNRLSNLAFSNVIKQPNVPLGTNDAALGVNRTTIVTVIPDIFGSGAGFPHPFNFTGTYVTGNNVFLTDIAEQASTRHAVTFSFNNQGCTASEMDTIDILRPLVIESLPDTLCAGSAAFPFYRDTINSPYYIDTVGTDTIEYNKITNIRTVDPNQSLVINILSSIQGSEIFEFIPSVIPSGDVLVQVIITYETTTTSPGGTSTQSADAIANIVIRQRPIPSFSLTALNYCGTGAPDTLRPSPAFINPSVTYFTLVADDTSGAFTLNGILTNDTILDPTLNYNTIVPIPNRDLNLRLTYTINQYGCADSITVPVTITAPLRPTFFKRPAYCLNEDPVQLNGAILPGGVVRSNTGRFLPANGLNDSTGVFDPKVAGVGIELVTYEVTDLLGCTYSFTDTLVVREPPQIRMTLDSSRSNTTFSNRANSFCGSVTEVEMRSTLIAGSAIDSIRYFGAGVLDSTLNPNSVFVAPGGPLQGTGGTFPVWAVVTDSFLCKGYDTLIVTIIAAPSVDIDSLFNDVPSNYGPGNIYISEHTYCKSAPIFLLDGNPSHRSGGNATGIISGFGVTRIDTNYYYNPSLVPFGIEVDTVVYTYTDALGCENEDIAIVKLDSVPIVTLTGFGTDTAYCLNRAPVQLTGTPDLNTSAGISATFSGFGVNPNTGLFTPFLAGIGPKFIIYEFIDNNNCVNSDTAIISINPLPVPMFTGYQNQYCTAAPDDTLISLNDTITGTYRFYGAVILDSAGILRPNLDTTGGNTTGTRTIYYSYTDSLNCSNVDSVNIFVHPTPEIVINGLDSAYCFSDPEDAISVFPSGILYNNDLGFSVSGNTITFDPDEDSAGVKTFTFSHVDNNGCSDTVTARTYVYKPTPPAIINLDTFYCETNDTIAINGAPVGGTFTGAGVWLDTITGIWDFTPSVAGVGTHLITYSIDDILTGYILGNGQPANLVCPADTSLSVMVRPLPQPKMLSPANNSSFCSNDSLQPLISINYINPTRNFFKDTSGGVGFTTVAIADTIGFNPLNVVFYIDTVYHFDPSAVTGRTHLITYIATDSTSGCQDSINFTFIVDQYTEPFFALDSAFCESADSVLLFGIPVGGTFARNSVPITVTPPYFFPNPGYASGQFLTGPVYDTVTYSVTDGACDGIDTQIVQINPVPQISFSTPLPHNTFCLGGDTVLLITNNNLGGFISGNGVPFGTQIFIPDLAGGGSHAVRYYYQDSLTGCDNEYIDTLFVYSMPDVDFSVDGGCQLDSLDFKPNNNLLGLITNSQVVDSITSVLWKFTSTDTLIGTAQSRTIDTVQYRYATAGVYYPQLIVANRLYCVDTQIIRLVVSPKVNTYPYVEDFEASSGEWFAESRDSARSLLWEWGSDLNPQGIAANSNNNVWATQTSAGYSGNEDAWVYSPCFDISTLDRPMVSLDYWSYTRQQFDGTVIEYQMADGSWAPLGEVGRGINWFNTASIAGEPGDEDNRVFSLGWSGLSSGWQNGRYKLDRYRGDSSVIRMRVAFASLKRNPQSFHDGFAFDNFIVKNRTRNVLLENMVHEEYGNMENINNRIYGLIYNTDLEKDVVLLQYHIETANGQGSVGANTDKFYQDNKFLGQTRAFEYGGPPSGRSFINGVDSNITYISEFLTDVDFEQDMLETPKFEITIDTFEHINNNFKIVANVTALEGMPTANYRIYTVISEDSLRYPTGSSYASEVHAVARENDEYHLNTNVGTNNRYNNRAWAVGENQRVEFNWDHSSNGFINYEPGDFHAVVFIQNISTKEVFQVATTREVSGTWVGINPVAAAEELNEVQSLKLYPNPAHDYFNLEFDQLLEHDYQWKLVDIRGVNVREGEIRAGNDQLRVDGLDCPPGTYILLLYNDNVFVQRKVVIGRP